MDDPQIARKRTLEWALITFRKYWDKGISPYNITVAELIERSDVDLEIANE